MKNERLALLDVRVAYKATVTKSISYWVRTRSIDEVNRTEYAAAAAAAESIQSCPTMCDTPPESPISWKILKSSNNLILAEKQRIYQCKTIENPEADLFVSKNVVFDQSSTSNE